MAVPPRSPRETHSGYLTLRSRWRNDSIVLRRPIRPGLVDPFDPFDPSVLDDDDHFPEADPPQGVRDEAQNRGVIVLTFRRVAVGGGGGEG